MTRSFKAPKQYAKHSYHTNAPLRKVSLKKGGAGKFGWGTDRDHIQTVMEEGAVAPQTGAKENEKVIIAPAPETVKAATAAAA
ncbi:hypothetical protein BT69DRAFT_1283954 [Atractiella rhizophila]|nr:hypothetical protein BT69DRAFT_1283954 [Atractiella rhizophila]